MTDLDSSLLQASAEDALSAVEKAGKRYPELIERWVRSRNLGALVAVAEAEAPATGARKEARRALQVLKSRGVKLPEPARKASLRSRVDATIEEAWLLPPDNAGTVGLAVVQRSVTKGLRVVFVFAHGTAGLRRVEGGALSQSQFKDALKRALADKESRPVQVPVAWARYRIAQAHARHAETRVPLPVGWASQAALLGALSLDPISHPFDAEGLELAEEDALSLSGQSMQLHALPEFRSWLPNQQGIVELLEDLGKRINTADGEPDQEALRAGLEEAVVLATDRYFAPERREDLVAMMKDAGLSVLARDGEARALEVSATILAIEKAGLITNPPREIPFLRGFFEKAISYLLMQNGGKLPIPAGARKDRAAAGEPASPLPKEPEAAGAEGA
jgi:hypothetical protein